MNYISQLLEIHNLAKTRLDELNDEISRLIAEQTTIAEALNNLIKEIKGSESLSY